MIESEINNFTCKTSKIDLTYKTGKIDLTCLKCFPCGACGPNATPVAGTVLLPGPCRSPCEARFVFFFKAFIYFLERGGGRETERERNITMCKRTAPYWGPGLQPRQVP